MRNMYVKTFENINFGDKLHSQCLVNCQYSVYYLLLNTDTIFNKNLSTAELTIVTLIRITFEMY